MRGDTGVVASLGEWESILGSATTVDTLEGANYNMGDSSVTPMRGTTTASVVGEWESI